MSTLLSKLIKEGEYKDDDIGGNFPPAVYPYYLQILIKKACPELDQNKLTKQELLEGIARWARIKFPATVARTITIELLLEMTQIRERAKETVDQKAKAA